MRYVDRIKTNAPTEPDNALILGQAVHTGIQKSLEEALREYAFSYPIITDEHINEMIKLEAVIPKARAAIPPNGKSEVEIIDKDFHGFIDWLVPMGYMAKEAIENPYGADVDIFDLYDFKYSNNVSNYKRSNQLHLYKYFFERNNPGKKIRNMYFLFVPKVGIRQKKDETLLEFRNRIESELSKVDVQLVPIEFDYEKVIEFLFGIKAVNEETEFPQETSYLCRYCEYQDYCEKGWNYFMKLPENKRRNIEKVNKRVIWIYGVPFCGKTTFANGFPDPLMINTDGNIKFVDAPYFHIKDEVKVEGRQTKRTLAWELFKETIAELEKKDNTFKTIVVDLLEDCYEHCRVYMYGQMGITHESDDSFRAWDKVRGEFLNTLKRLMNLDYENIILISHEDMTKDITKKGGDKITAIKPNLQDKVAVKVAGMVDVVARIVADGDTHSFCFKSNEVIFGGGRLKVNSKDISLDVDALFAVYDEANKNAASGAKAAPASDTGKTTGKGRSSRKAADKPQDSPKEEQTMNNTPKQETPQEATETAAEQQPEKETGTFTPGGSDKDDSIPAEENSANNAMNPPENPKEDEKPRRKRKARE